MLRAQLFTSLLILAFLSFISSRLSAAESPKADAQQLLANISKLVDIEAQGSSPFMLLADVQLQQGTKTVDGIYVMAWAAPDRYRRVIRFPNFSETEVVVDGKRYQQRSTQGVPYPVWKLEETMEFFHRMRLDEPAFFKRRTLDEQNVRRIDDASSRAHWTDSGNTAADCMAIQMSSSAIGKLCLNPTTHLPMNLQTAMDVRELAMIREHYEFSDYQSFQDKSFPRKLVLSSWNSQNVTVNIKKLIPVQTFPADEFSPPSGAQITPFCQDGLSSRGDLMPATQASVPLNIQDLDIAMYFRVNEHGGVQYAETVYTSAPLKDKEVLGWFVGTHFPVESCKGSAIPYETVIEFVTGH